MAILIIPFLILEFCLSGAKSIIISKKSAIFFFNKMRCLAVWETPSSFENKMASFSGLRLLPKLCRCCCPRGAVAGVLEWQWRRSYQLQLFFKIHIYTRTPVSLWIFNWISVTYCIPAQKPQPGLMKKKWLNYRINRALRIET